MARVADFQGAAREFGSARQQDHSGSNSWQSLVQQLPARAPCAARPGILPSQPHPPLPPPAPHLELVLEHGDGARGGAALGRLEAAGELRHGAAAGLQQRVNLEDGGGAAAVVGVAQLGGAGATVHEAIGAPAQRVRCAAGGALALRQQRLHAEGGAAGCGVRDLGHCMVGDYARELALVCGKQLGVVEGAALVGGLDGGIGRHKQGVVAHCQGSGRGAGSGAGWILFFLLKYKI